MSDHTTTVGPQVEAFVAQVRTRLTDLSEDEREELLGGLEADLVEKLADGADLGDPWLYAAELRAAAGLPEGRRPLVRTPRLRMPRGEDVDRVLDESRTEWSALTARHPAGARAWEVVATLRPAWWVLRAWAAVTLVDRWTGPWERVSAIPTLGVPLLGPVVLLAAIAASTLIGLGRLWPGSGPDRPRLTRIALLAANLMALGVLGTVAGGGSSYLASSPTWDSADYGGYPHTPRDGLRLDGSPIRNVFAYDAAGDPVTGVQLFRGNGDPLTVSADQAESGWRPRAERTVGCGWLNGSRQLFNVFPLADRVQRRGTCLDDADQPASLPVPPFAQVPPVTSPVPPVVEQPQPGEE